MTTQTHDDAAAAAMFAAFMDFKRQQGAEAVTVVTPLEAGRAKRAKAMAISKDDVRKEAAAAFDGDSLAATRLKAAIAATAGGSAIAAYAAAITAKYGAAWVDAVKAYNPKAPDPKNNLGAAVYDEQRERFIRDCKERGSSRPVARVYWSRVIQAADSGRGTKEAKPLAQGLREAAEAGAKRALNAEREGHKLTKKEGDALGFFLSACQLLGTDVPAMRAACAKARTVGVAKKG